MPEKGNDHDRTDAFCQHDEVLVQMNLEGGTSDGLIAGYDRAERMATSRSVAALSAAGKERSEMTDTQKPAADAPKPTKVAETQDGTILYNLDPIIAKWHWEVDYIHSYAQDSTFFARLSQRKLLGSRCTTCGYVCATPRSHCMQYGAATEWHELPQEGIVYTFTTRYFGGEAFLAETPFTLVLVEFGGVDTLFLSPIVGVEDRDVSIGMLVRARFLRNSRTTGTTCPRS